MNEIKIIKIEQINLFNTKNDNRLQFLKVKAFAMIKLIGLFLKEENILINPIEVIQQEFILKYGSNNLSLYYITIFTLIDVFKFLDKYNFINRNQLYKDLT